MNQDGHRIRTVLRLIASVVSGFLLLVPLSAIYGAAHLPVYHSWGLAHGSFTSAVPALGAASFVALGALRWFGKAVDVFPRLISSLSVLLLVTTLFWVDQVSHYTMSGWHLVVYAALFALFSILCLRATRPLLVPLFLLVPLLVDPLFGLSLNPSMNHSVMELLGYDVLHQFVPAAAATGLAALLALLVRSRRDA